MNLVRLSADHSSLFHRRPAKMAIPLFWYSMAHDFTALFTLV